MAKRRVTIQLGLLLTLACVVFGKTLFFDFVEYDDPAYVSQNHFVLQGVTTESIRWAFLYDSQPGQLLHQGVENLWHPLTWLSHMLDIELFGVDNPSGHHATNVVLYLLTLPLVFWSCSKILGNSWAGFFVALLWMIHPMKVESVAWVSERKDILSGLFFWAALSCSIKSFNSPPKWKWIGLAFFVAALLSKPSVVVLPPLIILVSWYMKEEKWNLNFMQSQIKQWWGWFLAAAIIASITIIMQSAGSHDYFIQHSSVVGRVKQSAVVFWFYVYRIVFPWNLNFFYEYPALNKIILGIATFALLGVTYLALMKRNQWRSFFVGYCWMIVCWLPVSGIIYVGSSFTTDRYMYLALAGFLFPIAKFLANTNWGKASMITLAAIWAVLSWIQTDVWKDGQSLFEHSTKAQPKASIGWNNLGSLQRMNGQFNKALLSYQKAVEINSFDYTAWHNLGVTSAAKSDMQQAASYYERSLVIYPEYAPALLNLGNIKKAAGDIQGAKELYYRGKDQDHRMLWLSCDCEMQLGNFNEAEVLLKKLEALPIKHPGIIEGMQSLRQHLSSLKN